MLDAFNLFDTLGTCVGLIVIVWIGFRAFPKQGIPASAVVAILVWLTAMAAALFMIFGPEWGP
jgi:hypothetical protein